MSKWEDKIRNHERVRSALQGLKVTVESWGEHAANVEFSDDYSPKEAARDFKHIIQRLDEIIDLHEQQVL